MTQDLSNLFPPLLMFALAAALTPGPNNVMLTASGANYGFVRTIPHILGVMGGFFVLLVAISAGLGVLFERYPQAQLFLKILGSLYLCYFAWRIATARPANGGTPGGRPFTFLQAASFQFVNPKAWLMGLSAMSAFTLSGEHYIPSVSMLVAVFIGVTIASTAVWAGFGTAIGRWLKSARSFRIFNGIMASLTLGSIVLLFI